MKALLCSPPSPIILHSPPPSERRISLIFPVNTPNSHRARNLQANAKGFAGGGSPKPGAADKNPIQKIKKEDDEVPEVVFQRIIKRILLAVGLPLGLGLALLKFFNVAKEGGFDLPLWLPFTTTLVTFAASTLGIAYGSLSSSWDPEKPGSVFGFKEAQENWVEVWKEENNSP